ERIETRLQRVDNRRDCVDMSRGMEPALMGPIDDRSQVLRAVLIIVGRASRCRGAAAGHHFDYLAAALRTLVNSRPQLIGSVGFAPHDREVTTMGRQWRAGSDDPRRRNAVPGQVITKTQ